MKAAKKLLLDQLTATLLPHLALPLGGRLPRGIGKTLGQLTNQILRQRARPAGPPRLALTNELAGLLDAYLHDAADAPAHPGPDAPARPGAPARLPHCHHHPARPTSTR